MHLQINQGEKKYMPVTKKPCTDGPSHIEIVPYKFEIVHSFNTWDRRLTAKTIPVLRSKNAFSVQADVSLDLGGN
jgi:hypothetical protein